ncbi:DNA-binding transcription factor yap1 [Basidiobolus ranarum]|uniref:DNA-binding transcription factor yap1 n=1 Tax=Basidiobolus ranarum TaxID=34480 RepID=A0ABR2X427_9FUNG
MNDNLAYQLQSAQSDLDNQGLLAAAITHNQMAKIEEYLKRKNDNDEEKTPIKHNHQEERLDNHLDSPEDGTKSTAKKPGRKPLTTMPTDKRKAQNRAAQRAFRDRKDKYVKELEDKVKELEDNSEKSQEENEKLRKLLLEVKAENVLLKGNFTFQPPTNALSEVPTLVDLLKNTNNPQNNSPLFSSFPWTPNSNSGEVNFIHGSESPENQGLSSGDDKSPFNNESSPYASISHTATPEMSNLVNTSQQHTMYQPALHEPNFFAPIGEIVDDPLISVNQGFTSPQLFTDNGESHLNLPFDLSDYRDPTGTLFDDNLTGGLSSLPAFFEEGWNEDFNTEQIFSPIQNTHDVTTVGDGFANSHSESGAVDHEKADIHISLEDCKVLEYASLPLDFDINELCDSLRRKATCGGRFPCPEKTEQLAQL